MGDAEDGSSALKGNCTTPIIIRMERNPFFACGEVAMKIERWRAAYADLHAYFLPYPNEVVCTQNAVS